MGEYKSMVEAPTGWLYVLLGVGFSKFTFSDAGDSAKKNMPVFLKHGI